MKDDDRISRSGATIIFFAGAGILIFGGAPSNIAAVVVGTLLILIALKV
jgi:hypothetical protein